MVGAISLVSDLFGRTMPAVIGVAVEGTWRVRTSMPSMAARMKSNVKSTMSLAGSKGRPDRACSRSTCMRTPTTRARARALKRVPAGERQSSSARTGTQTSRCYAEWHPPLGAGRSGLARHLRCKDSIASVAEGRWNCSWALR